MLSDHVSFWIGVFLTLLLIAVATISGFFMLFHTALDWISLLAGALCGTIVLLSLATIFRRMLLKALIGSSQTSLEQCLDAASAFATSAVKQDPADTKQKAAEFSRNVIAWYSWSNFYRWVITTSIAIFGVFSVLSGTILLIQQNKEIVRNNEIISKQFALLQSREVMQNLQKMEKFKLAQEELAKSAPKPEQQQEQAVKEFIAKHPNMSTLLDTYEQLSYYVYRKMIDPNMLGFYHGNQMATTYSRFKEQIQDVRCNLDNGDTDQFYEYFQSFVECGLNSSLIKDDKEILQCMNNTLEKIRNNAPRCNQTSQSVTSSTQKTE